MTDKKICSRCNRAGDPIRDYYLCGQAYRSECKKCTIKRNVLYQKARQSWKYRYIDGDAKRTYATEYYARNKARFAEYRRQFKLRYPSYYKEYHYKRKGKI